MKRIKKYLLSLLVLIVLSLIGFSVTDKETEVQYDESAFEEELYEIEGEELAMLEGELDDVSFEDEEMMTLSDEEMEALFEEPGSGDEIEEVGDSDAELEEGSGDAAGEETEILDENGTYTSQEDVAEYIYIYGKLPSNYITKKEAQELGWNSSEGNLDEVAPGKSIGGDKFGNYEGMLPKEEGRQYYECDIDFDGGYRNGKRLVYSNDGLIFYTEDHYETFVQLY